MKKWLIILVGLLLLSSCDSQISLSEIKFKHLPMNVYTYFDQVRQYNGNYLYFYDKDTLYVFFNRYTVIQGEELEYVTDVQVEVDGETLSIYVNQQKTDDYNQKTFNPHVLYQLKVNAPVHTIKIFNNGKESHFDGVSGN